MWLGFFFGVLASFLRTLSGHAYCGIISLSVRVKRGVSEWKKGPEARWLYTDFFNIWNDIKQIIFATKG